ncbi:MAG TPA: DNA repair protein RecO [Balneolaceae bacterium]|nr:DNA repair protein RecO [Balneolaceae bacterium]
MLVHTTAIILKSIDYGDSSKILTVFSREDGKIALIAHSAKKPKSKFSGLIEVGHILDMVYYMKKSRSVQILKEASFEEKTFNLRQNFEKMAISLSGLELIEQLLHENEVNKPLFNFTKIFLLWLNETDIQPAKVFPYLQLRLIEIMGLGLQIKVPDNSGSSFYLNIEHGTLGTQAASSRSYKLTGRQFRYINKTMQSRSSSVFKIPFENGELKELVTYLDRYLYFHVEGLRERKSDAIFEQLLN